MNRSDKRNGQGGLFRETITLIKTDTKQILQQQVRRLFKEYKTEKTRPEEMFVTPLCGPN